MTLLSFLLGGCDPLQRADDTTGEQRAARWEWYGRLVVEHDSALTLTRIRLDTTGVRQRHDVLLARFEFDPSAEAGDEYDIALGLELGRLRDLPLNEPIRLGPPPARIGAQATITRLGTPLRPDSVRGTFVLGRRGLRQFMGRVDAVLHFTAWADTTHRVRYELHQRVYGVK
ncbi:MAG: hypothetical protein ACREMJ_00040 [Gemmatimonadales bacterium]